MAQSLSNVLLHITFSTKDRRPLIDLDIEKELHAILAAQCRGCGCPPHRVGGADDHVHVCCSLSRTTTIADLVEEIKKRSSRWIKTKGRRYARFGWQGGYNCVSIGQSGLEALKRYIDSQRDHHRKVTFQDELRGLLTKYRIPFDEDLIWT